MTEMHNQLPRPIGPFRTAEAASSSLHLGGEGWTLSRPDQQALMRVANDAIAHGVQQGSQLTPNLSMFSQALQQEGAAFITLKLHGQLRGCIGSLHARQALVLDVAHNAFSAAFRDPRFVPLGLHELMDLKISISVLTPPVELRFASEDDLLNQIRPGRDGLILEDCGRRGTFLPAVWEQLPTTEMFWSQLKRKASLPADHWSSTVRVWRYESRTID